MLLISRERARMQLLGCSTLVPPVVPLTLPLLPPSPPSLLPPPPPPAGRITRCPRSVFRELRNVVATSASRPAALSASCARVPQSGYGASPRSKNTLTSATRIGPQPSTTVPRRTYCPRALTGTCTERLSVRTIPRRFLARGSVTDFAVLATKSSLLLPLCINTASASPSSIASPRLTTWPTPPPFFSFSLTRQHNCSK
jgi:hypothetical protein